MAFIARRAVQTLVAGDSTSVFNVTHPDITTPDCAVFFVPGATADNRTPNSHGWFQVGFWESASGQGSASNSYEGLNQASTSTFRWVDYTDAVALIGIGKTSTDGVIRVTGTVPNGIQCQYTDDFAYAHKMVVLLMEGCTNAQVVTNAAWDSGTVNLGWRPTFLICAGTTSSSEGGSNTGKGFYGFACDNGGALEQVALGWEASNNQSSVSARGGIDNSFFALRSSGGSWYERYFIASINPTGFTFGNVGQSMSNQCILAVELPAGQNARCGSYLSPSTLGAFSIPISYPSGDAETECALISTIANNAVNPGNLVDADGWGGGAVDGNLDQSAWCYADEEGAADTKAQSLMSAGNALLAAFAPTSATVTETKVANVTGMSPNIAFDMTVSDANPHYMAYLAIQGVSAAPGDDVETALPRLAFDLSTATPTVRTTENVAVSLPREALSLRTSAPAVDAKMPVEVTLPREALTLTARAPSTNVGDSALVQLPREALTLVARAPSVLVGADTLVTLPREALTLRTSNPLIDAKMPVETTLPRLGLSLRTTGPAVQTAAQNVETDLPRTALDLTARTPATRTTENVAVQLVSARMSLRTTAPPVVVEGTINVALPREALTLTPRTPQVQVGDDQNITLPRLALTLTARAPGVEVEGAVNVSVDRLALQVRGSGPNTYLAGDKISTVNAPLVLRTARPRIMVGDPSTMKPSDGGVIGPTTNEVVVPPTTPEIV